MLKTILSVVSLTSVVFGVVPFSSEDCTGVVKWKNSTDPPGYLWKLNEQNKIIFCPDVQCTQPSPGQACREEVGYAPPGGNYPHSCGCDDGADVCTTVVYASSPWGPIVSVSCRNFNCAAPKTCELRTQGAADPNGYYDAKCTCQ